MPRRGKTWDSEDVNSIGFMGIWLVGYIIYRDIYDLVSGLEYDFYFPIQLGMSSSQLTFIFFRGVAQPPTRISGVVLKLGSRVPKVVMAAFGVSSLWQMRGRGLKKQATANTRAFRHPQAEAN